MLELGIWQVLLPLIAVIFGIGAVIYGVMRARKKEREFQHYLRERLPDDIFDEISEELSKKIELKELEDWKYNSFLRRIDQFDNESINILDQLNLEKWLNIQNEIVSLSKQVKNVDVPGWKIRKVISEFTDFFDEDDDKILVNVRKEHLEEIILKIKAHRSALSAKNKNEKTGEADNA